MTVAIKPFVLEDCSLTLLSLSGTVPQEMRCQLTEARLVPSPPSNSANQLETFCDTHSAGGGLATWALRLAGFQSFADINDLSRLLFEKEGEEVAYTLLPYGGVVSDTAPGFEGFITAVPVDIGGVAKTFATFTTDQPCTGKPTMLVAP
jgi:hypothetical protein